MLGSVSDIIVTSWAEGVVQMPLRCQGWSEPFFTQKSLGAGSRSEKRRKSFDLCDYVNKEF